jgi:enolase
LVANAILGVSMAVCRAGAAFKKVPLYQYISELSGFRIHNSEFRIPFAMFNILNGGAHAKNGLDIQEFMVIPQKKTFIENLVLCNKIFGNLKENIEKSFGKDHLELGDEGGFAPPVSNTEQALFLLKNAVGVETDVKFALDCASSEFYKDGKYNIDDRELTKTELLEFYESLINNFQIISIEDPFSEEDWQGFEEILKQLGQKILIVGDDLTTTNIKRIKEAHNKSACNGVILKLNQIGTVFETIEASNLAKSFGWKTIVSHRSGETMDNFIADFAVGTGADFIKSGSPAKEERMVKYKRLLEIEQELLRK